MKPVTVMIWREDSGPAWSGSAAFAENEVDRVQGLRGVRKILPGQGMLFRTQGGSRWTTVGMRVPIDMVWIKRGTVLKVDRDVMPGKDTIVAPEGSTALLEVGAGHATKVCEGCALHIVSR